MYMPRLRAAQHELFAVRACAAEFAASGNVSPILEPVKPLDARFASRVDAIASEGLTCSLVLNPSVGEHRSARGWERVGDFLIQNGLLDSHNLAIISGSDSDHSAMSDWVAEARSKGSEFDLDIIHERGGSTSLAGNTYRQVRYNVANDRTVPSSHGLPLSGKPVIWSADPFPIQNRNVDYVGKGESVFTTRASAYVAAGYAGISDFLTIGERYFTGGGPAYAVAIHLTYRSGDSILLRHFCSDSNDTQDDPAGKFFEALEKAVQFISSASLPSNPGIEALLDLYSRQHFPGLGKVKEYSMVNHMMVLARAV